ncbi:MAG: beta strand repeat-containing protein, partial [Acidobacteriota bacterium]
MTAVPPIFGSTIMAPKAGGKEAHNGGSGTEWIVPVMVGQNGPIGIDMVNSTGVKDSYNLPVAPLPFTTGETYTIAPKVVSLNRSGANPTNAATVRWVVTFNQAVTGLTAANFALTGSGATLGSVTALPNQSGVVDNKSWRIEASTGSSTGLIGLNMVNSTGATAADGAAVSGLPFTGQTFSIAPKVVSITRAGANPATGTTGSYTVTFSEPVTGLTAANFAITGTGTTGATVGTPTGSGTTWTVPVTFGAATGTVGISMANSTGVTDSDGSAVGNLPFADGEAYTIAARVVSIARKDPNPTAASTVAWTVTFSKSMTGLTAANFSLAAVPAGTGTAITGVTGSGTTWTVNATVGTATGMLGLEMANGTGTADPEGAPVANVPFATGESYSIAPRVVSITRAGANPAGGEIINYTVTFSEPVTGVTAANFGITGIGSTGASVGTPTGSGTTWTIPVTVGTATGTVGISMLNSTGMADSNSNPVSNVPFTGGESYTIAGKVLSINRAGANPTSATTVAWTVTFSRNITGVTAANFALTGGTGASVTTVTGSGTTWTVNANVGTTTATLGLEMANGTGTADPDGAAVASLPYTKGEAYTIAPKVVSITRADPNPAGGTTINYTVTFSEPVTGVTAANFGITGTGSNGATVGTPTGSGTTWTIPVTVGTATGTVGISMLNSTGVADSDSHPVGNLPFTGGETYAIAAKVLSINRAGASPTSAATVAWTVTFSKSVTGVTAANFSVKSAAGTGASVTTVTGSGTTWTVNANVGTTTGTLALEMVNGTGTADPDGAAVANTPFVTGESYAILPKVVSIVRADPNPSGAATVNYTVTFNEAVTGVTAANFTITGTGSTGASIGTPTGSGTTWTVPVTVGTATGVVGINMANSTGVKNGDNNGLGNVPVTTGETYTIAPRVVSINRAGSSPSAASPLSWTVTFNEAVTGVTAANFALTGGTGASVTTVTGSGTTWTVTADPGTTTGTLGLEMANGTGTADASGAAVANVPFATGQTYAIAPKVVSIKRADPSPAGGTTINYTVTFSEPVTGVTAANFGITGTGSTGASIGTPTGSGTTWTIPVTVGTATGTVGISMLNSTGVADSDSHPVGNLPFTGGETYAIAAKVLSINRAGASPTSGATVAWTVTFSKSVTGVTAANFSVKSAAGTGASVTTVTGS